jgi:hypothetical protein
LNPADLVPYLTALAAAADAATGALPGAGGEVAAFVAAALRFAADLAGQGVDPTAHLERVHAADPSLQSVEAAWAEALREKFGA